MYTLHARALHIIASLILVFAHKACHFTINRADQVCLMYTQNNPSTVEHDPAFVRVPGFASPLDLPRIPSFGEYMCWAFGR